MGCDTIKQCIQAGNAVLGIEFGSTRIKAVLIDESHGVIASGSHDWENRFENQIWTYSLEDIWTGLQDSYRKMAEDVKDKYGIVLTKLGAIGFSAMMHGYMAFDQDGELLVPFRTWRNTMTEQAAKELTELFDFNMPQRWSGSHIYQAILNEEEHVKNVAFITTLAGYIHWKLTGKTDEYMVKEVEVPMMRMPLIFLETRVEKLDAAMIDGLLEAFFSISQHMAQEGQKHCLCWWDKKTDGWNFYNVANAMQLEEVYAHVFQSMFFSQGNATIDSFEKERKEQFSEVIYITEYWKEKEAVFDDWNLTLLLERREARKEEGEALVPYIFSAETMGEDIDRILTAYRSADYGA